MYTGYERIAVSNTVLDVDDLTIPSGTTFVELQADTKAVRYTMDNSSTPAQAVGMVLHIASDPQSFLVEDVKRMKFVRGDGSDAALNLHYFG